MLGGFESRLSRVVVVEFCKGCERSCVVFMAGVDRELGAPVALKVIRATVSPR